MAIGPYITMGIGPGATIPLFITMGFGVGAAAVDEGSGRRHEDEDMHLKFLRDDDELIAVMIPPMMRVLFHAFTTR